MARARNIKPGLFKNEVLAELGLFERLLFIGLWCLADREGRLEDRPKRIKMELFPGDSFDVDQGLAELARSGFIERYQSCGFAVVSVANFHKHQSPHTTEKDSLLPDINGYLTVNERARGKALTGQQRYVHVSEVSGVTTNNDTLTVNAPLNTNALTVGAPTHNALIPDSLIPDTGFTDSLIPEEDQKPLVASAETTGEQIADDDQHDDPEDLDEPEPVGDPKTYTADFESFWKAYPRRNTASPKKAAWRVWRARIRDGVDPQDLIVAAGKYHGEQRAMGKVGSSYVKLPATFLGPDEHWREYVGKAGVSDEIDPTTVDGVKYPRQVPRNYQCGPEEFWGFDAFADHVYHHKTHHMDYTRKNPRGDAC